MKKYFYVFWALLIVFLSGNLFAGSVDYLSNQSAEYMRTFNRNAATDSADVVYYNPAGVMKMQNGLFTNVSGQYLDKNYTVEDKNASHNWNSGEYKANTPSVIPAAYLVYKQDNWAAFAAFTVPAGGGVAEYDGGTPVVRNAVYATIAASPYAALRYTAVQEIDSLYTSSMYLAGTLGSSYKVNDILSVSLGARYMRGIKKFEIKVTNPEAWTTRKKILTVDLDAQGIGGIIGLNVTPIKDINIGIRYETVTKLVWDTSIETNHTFWDTTLNSLGYKDGRKDRKDLPALFAAGISYDIIPQLKISSCFTYYFIKQAEWRHYNGVNYRKDYDNGWEGGLAVEYKVIPQLLVSIGYMHTDTGGNKNTWTEFGGLALDSNSYGMGAKYEIISGVNVNLALSWIKYIDGTSKDNYKYSKDNKSISLGVEYKVM
jgi:long-chain fatty acid transport protein